MNVCCLPLRPHTFGLLVMGLIFVERVLLRLTDLFRGGLSAEELLDLWVHERSAEGAGESGGQAEAESDRVGVFDDALHHGPETGNVRRFDRIDGGKGPYFLC